MNQVVLMQTWDQICETIKNNNLADWNQFSSIKDKLIPQAMSDGFLLLTIDSDFLQRWTIHNFQEPLQKALYILFKREYVVEIELDEVTPQPKVNRLIDIDEQTQSPKQEIIFKQATTETNTTNFSSEDFENSNLEPASDEQRQILESLEPDKTFESFVIGESNRLAYSMAVQVAENPGNQVLNPLFIYGKSGLGKTHLLRAIQNYVITTQPQLKVIYVDTNELVNDYTQAATEHDRSKLSFHRFREKYEAADVLLIDDVQFLQGKKQTLDNVFQILNNLITRGKQIIFSADRAPKVIDVDERYTSRFLQGGTCDIQPPEIETKIAIIKLFIKEYNQQSLKDQLYIPEDIITFIAENSGSNIRELKSAITLIIYKYSFSGSDIDKEELKTTLLNHFTMVKSNLTIEDIQKTVEEYYKISHSDLIGKSRSKNIAYPRQICFYLCRTILDIPYDGIGKKFNRDHSTVLHGANKIDQEILKNRNLKEEIEVLKKIIKDL